MGYDQQHEPSESSPVLVAAAVVGVPAAILAILLIVGVGLFFVRSASVSRAHAVAVRDRAVAQARTAQMRAEVAVQQAARVADAVQPVPSTAIAPVIPSPPQAVPAPSHPRRQVNLIVNIDRDGQATLDDNRVDTSQVAERLVELKSANDQRLVVTINADPECPVKFVVAVQEACTGAGADSLQIAVAE